MGLFKSKKIYYLYNPDTLNYERVYPTARQRFFSVVRHLSIGLFFGFVVFFIFISTFSSPMESLLQKENRLLQTQYEVLDLQLTEALKVLDRYVESHLTSGKPHANKDDPSNFWWQRTKT